MWRGRLIEGWGWGFGEAGGGMVGAADGVQLDDRAGHAVMCVRGAGRVVEVLVVG